MVCIHLKLPQQPEAPAQQQRRHGIACSGDEEKVVVFLCCFHVEVCLPRCSHPAAAPPPHAPLLSAAPAAGGPSPASAPQPRRLALIKQRESETLQERNEISVTISESSPAAALPSHRLARRLMKGHIVSL